MHAGEGGIDSKLFIKDLCYVYRKYAEKKNLKWSIVSESLGQIVLLIEGQRSFETFQHESGKHCVQRIPPTERNGRSHTSTISVAVLPIPAKTNFVLNLSEVTIEATRGKGPGGQHKNVTDSAIRVKHNPTGLTAYVDGRDQHQNKKKALKVLSARVEQIHKTREQGKYDRNRKFQLDGGGRSNKIRTYNFIKNRAVDHNLNKKTTRIGEIMKGNLDLLLK